MAYYKPGTHINLKDKDDYALFTKVSNLAYKYLTPIFAAAFLMDWILRANGF